MFTGIISDVGEIVTAEAKASGARFSIACRYAADAISVGASIACSGVCLTVTGLEQATDRRTMFAVDVSHETLARTTLGDWAAGTRVNLERSLVLGDELGGHLVSGHVDGVADIAARNDDGGTARFDFVAPGTLARFIAEKGSVALDGTSLTVNGVDGTRFWATLIPHTLQVTTWGVRRPGDRVNLEVDLLARYVARLTEAENL